MNKGILVLLLLLGAFGSLSAQHSLEVKITNIRAPRGNILVALFNNGKDFLEKAVEVRTITAKGADVTVSFDNLPEGDYAVSVIHDENGNGELDKNFMGIPKEGFCFGNNSMGTFGPPPFDKAKVRLKGKLNHEVALRYM